MSSGQLIFNYLFCQDFAWSSCQALLEPSQDSSSSLWFMETDLQLWISLSRQVAVFIPSVPRDFFCRWLVLKDGILRTVTL